MKELRGLLILLWSAVGFDLLLFYLLYQESIKKEPYVFWELLFLAVLVAILIILLIMFRKSLKKGLNIYNFYDHE